MQIELFLIFMIHLSTKCSKTHKEKFILKGNGSYMRISGKNDEITIIEDTNEGYHGDPQLLA